MRSRTHSPDRPIAGSCGSSAQEPAMLPAEKALLLAAAAGAGALVYKVP